MKLTKFLSLTTIIILSILISACNTVTDPAELYKGEAPEHIFKNGEDSLRSKSYAEAIKRFEALDVQYPFGHDTEIAQLHLIYAYYMNNDYASAEAAADRFVHAHPTSPHVDYAYYMRGLANYYQNLGVFERMFTVDLATRDLSQIRKSYGDFAVIVHLFPGSYYAPAAHQYLVYLRNILADHQLDVARYYFGRKAYVAAADRANILVRHYQGSPLVPEGLVIMVESYRMLHMDRLADDTLRVLEYNYPSSCYTHEIALFHG